jgi:hypothetical protein
MQSGVVLAGKYRLESLLGRGGMGSVWRATHLGLHAPVAIKLIDAGIVTNPEALARFVREARAAAGLRSPHVVQILDHGIDEASHTPFIAMELLEGESLGVRLQRTGRLTPAETARVVSQVARALTRAHEAGIVHRDLKPDNIFLVANEDEEIAKILDFGIAKSRQELGVDSATRTGAVMGTPYYMSPEQISGTRDVDHRTDVWALGVIACECLTGVRPFEAESVGGLTLKICVEPPPIPSRLGPVPPGFDAWFSRATARAFGDRFQSARELADELRRVAEHAGAVLGGTVPGASVPPPRTMGPVSRTAGSEAFSTSGKGSRVGTIVGLVLALAVLGGLGALAATRLGSMTGAERELASTSPPLTTAPSPPAAPPAPTASTGAGELPTPSTLGGAPSQPAVVVTPAGDAATSSPPALGKTRKAVVSPRKPPPPREPTKEPTRPTARPSGANASSNLGVLDERR